ncbi:MAG: lasso RiPP family leader peptide-containing protein [Mycobacteriales bacterium]
MNLPTAPPTAEARAYEPPAVVVLGSVEAVTLSSRNGSISDFRGRQNRAK